MKQIENQFKVEKGIDIPNRRDIARVYPLPMMGIGDSFIIPKDNRKMTATQSIVLSACRSYNLTHDKIKITTRIVKDGVRVWRVK